MEFTWKVKGSQDRKKRLVWLGLEPGSQGAARRTRRPPRLRGARGDHTHRRQASGGSLCTGGAAAPPGQTKDALPGPTRHTDRTHLAAASGAERRDSGAKRGSPCGAGMLPVSPSPKRSPSDFRCRRKRSSPEFGRRSPKELRRPELGGGAGRRWVRVAAASAGSAAGRGRLCNPPLPGRSLTAAGAGWGAGGWSRPDAEM